MLYTVIRKERDKIQDKYFYEVLQCLDLKAYTNYRCEIDKAIWVVQNGNEWRLEQINPYYGWTSYIPIVNAIVTFCYYRKYNIFLNNKVIGKVEIKRQKGILAKEKHFIIGENDYFIGLGNTFVKRPFKQYEWPIETKNGKAVATVKKEYKKAIYYIQIKEELIDVELIVLMVMMSDMEGFSRESNTRGIKYSSF